MTQVMAAPSASAVSAAAVVWCGVVSVVWCGWCGVVGVVWRGVVRYGVVGVVWRGVVWCGVVWLVVLTFLGSFPPNFHTNP